MKKRIAYKRYYMDSVIVTPVGSYIEDVIEDPMGVDQKLEITGNILNRLIKIIIDKNMLTENELYYILHGNELAYMDEEESFNLIEE
jgi:hypothetical protein